VVEFPEDSKPGTGAAGKGKPSPEDDVLAQIERARAELDSAVAGKGQAPSADPLSGGKFKPEPRPSGTAGSGKPTIQHAAAQPAAAGTGGAIDNPFEPGGSSGIALPSLLTIQQVYERAGLASGPDTLDINRIEQMLADPEMADLALSIRARTVKMTLKTMGKELHDVLLDAAKRDQALDAYGQWLAEAVQTVEAQVQAANARLRDEIAEFTARKNAEIEGNTALLAQAHAARQSYGQDKAKEEQRLFEVAAPFVAPGENPVVVGGSSAPKGDAK
jgi:hypothetical protein